MSNNVRFLLLVKILVDETRKDEPMARQEILERCEQAGAPLTEMTFERYLMDMQEAGIIIGRDYRKIDAGPKKNVYWYADGWI